MPAVPSTSPHTPASKLTLAIGFSLLCSLLLPFYRYELTPDAITYLAIAKQYAAGYVNEAISDYWSPLFSWLIAALLGIHVPDILAAKIVCIGAGILALLGLRELARLYALSLRSSLAMFAAAAVLLASCVFEFTGPDLLFAAILFYYLRLVLDLDFPARPFTGVLCGLLGGLAYLAKGYGLAFFAAHFTLFCALHWLTAKDPHRRAAIPRHFLSGALTFSLIVLVWMVPLHAKYGVWTTGSTGKFNYRLVGPESHGYPHLSELEAPRSPHATNAWQEPPVSKLKDWNIFDGAFTLKHEEKLIARDTLAVARYWIHAAPLFVLAILAYLLYARSKADPREWLFPLLTIALFAAGYLLITVEQRYLWLTGLLLLWLTFCALDRCLHGSLPRSAETFILCLVALSFMVEPLRTLRYHFQLDRGLSTTANQLRPVITPGTRIASCNNWGASAALAYQLDARYFGTPWTTLDAYEDARGLNPDYSGGPPPPPDWQSLNQTLQAAGIQYFLAWPGCTQPAAGATGAPQVLPVPLRREQVQK